MNQEAQADRSVAASQLTSLTSAVSIGHVVTKDHCGGSYSGRPSTYTALDRVNLQIRAGECLDWCPNGQASQP